MNCNYCEDRLSDYLEGALTATERALVEEHLKGCSACNELFDSVRSIMHWGRDLPAQMPPPWPERQPGPSTIDSFRFTRNETGQVV